MQAQAHREAWLLPDGRRRGAIIWVRMRCPFAIQRQSIAAPGTVLRATKERLGACCLSASVHDPDEGHRGQGPRDPRLFHAQLFQLVAQRAEGDAELGGGLGLVLAVVFQRLLDRGAFQVLDIGGQRAVARVDVHRRVAAAGRRAGRGCPWSGACRRRRAGAGRARRCGRRRPGPGRVPGRSRARARCPGTDSAASASSARGRELRARCGHGCRPAAPGSTSASWGRSPGRSRSGGTRSSITLMR